MKNLFKLFVFSLLFINYTPAFTQSEVLLTDESFESGLPSYWDLATPSCTGYEWGFSTSYHNTGSYSIYFPSYNASSNCFQSLVAPTWSFVNVHPNDSIKLVFNMYRSSTYSTHNDLLAIVVVDSNFDQKLTTQIIHRYYGATPPVPTSGWVQYYWKIKCNDINSGNRIKFTFVFQGVSDQGDNIYLDDVKIYRINYKSLTLTKPNGGEIINLGSNYNITWTNKNVSQIKIEYTNDDGGTWNTIASNVNASLQTYSWSVPSSSTNASQTCMVRISDMSDQSITDESDAYFELKTQKGVTLTKPNGGEIINLGSNYDITWINNYVNQIKIEFTIDGGVNWNTIASNINASLQTYSWTVPSSPTVASQTCKVRITDMSDQSIKDESDAYFELKSQKSVSLGNPNGSENIPSQHNYDITWTSTNVTDLKIEFSIDGGINWNSIASTVNASTQKYTWMVPPVVSSSCKLRLTDNSDQSIKDESDSYFSIYNGVSIKENLSFSEVNIYPSPASDQINLTYDLLRSCDVSLKLFDISGKIINDFGTQSQLSGSYIKHIETHELQNGIYYFELIIDNNIIKKEIVIYK